MTMKTHHNSENVRALLRDERGTSNIHLLLRFATVLRFSPYDHSTFAIRCVRLDAVDLDAKVERVLEI